MSPPALPKLSAATTASTMSAMYATEAARLETTQPKPMALHAAVAQHDATKEPAHDASSEMGAERSAPMAAGP
jgi:hypothetical protein